MKKMKIQLLGITLLVFLGLIGTVFADTHTGGRTGGGFTVPNPIGCPDFDCVAKKIIDSLLLLAIPVVAIMVLIGGFQILTAGGEEEKYKKGRRTIWYAVLGYIAIWMAKAVVSIIQSLFRP